MTLHPENLPWPDVQECYGYADTTAARLLHPNLTCDQCDGSHDHQWVSHPLPAGLATRCTICGARRCGGSDPKDCNSRRHHLDPHTTGEPVGGRWLRP